MSLVEEIRGYCSRNEAGGDESLLRAKLSTIAARKISLTCDTLTRVPVGQSTSPSTPPCGGGTFLQVEGNEPKRVGGRLRSPAPSPIPSPIASPSPTRTRYLFCGIFFVANFWEYYNYYYFVKIDLPIYVYFPELPKKSP